MRSTSSLGTLTGLLCVLGCADADGDGTPFAVRDSAGIVIAESSAPKWSAGEAWTVEPEPTVEIGRLEGDPRYMFERVGAADLVGDRLVVADGGAMVLKLYSMDGEYVGELGGRGEGPGEFSDLTAVWQSGDASMAVQDMETYRITELSIDGREPRTMRMSMDTGFPDVLQGVFDDGSYVVFSIVNIDPDVRPPVSRDSVQLLRYGSDGAVLGTLAGFLGMRRYRTQEGGSGVDPFSPWAFARVSGATVYLADSSFPEVRLVDPDGRLVRIIRWTAPERLARADAMRRLEDAIRQGEDPEPRLRRLGEAPDAGPLPAFSNMLVDPEGFLWVREYAVPEHALTFGPYQNQPGGDWRVFDPSGRWLGTVSLPPDLIPSSIESDVIVGTRRDELGVQYVRVHRLRRG